MAECPSTPSGFLSALLAVVQTALGTAPSTVPGQVIVGPRGASNAYTCCDAGKLSIEWLELADTLGEPRNCNNPVQAVFRVSVDRCVQTFAPGGSGAPVPIAQRNTEALAQLDETWRLYTALRCAVYQGVWSDCWVLLGSVIPKEPDGLCWGYYIDIHTDFQECC